MKKVFSTKTKTTPESSDLNDKFIEIYNFREYKKKSYAVFLRPKHKTMIMIYVYLISHFAEAFCVCIFSETEFL